MKRGKIFQCGDARPSGTQQNAVKVAVNRLCRNVNTKRAGKIPGPSRTFTSDDYSSSSAMSSSVSASGAISSSPSAALPSMASSSSSSTGSATRCRPTTFSSSAVRMRITPLGVTAHDAHFGNAGTHQRPGVGDHHDLIAVIHLHGADHGTVTLGDFDRNNATGWHATWSDTPPPRYVYRNRFASPSGSRLRRVE